MKRAPLVYCVVSLPCAAQSGSAPLGAGYGLAFGLGAAVTPLLLPLLGVFAAKLRAQQAWLGLWMRRGAGGVLLALGVHRIFLGMT